MDIQNKIAWRTRHTAGAASQRGAAALVITLILVVIASLSSLLVNKATFSEQQLSGTDTRTKEVYSAAVGALDYNTAWLQSAYELETIDVVWSAVDADGYGVAGATANPPAFANSTDGLATVIQGVDVYSVISPGTTYTLLTDETDPPFIVEVSSNASATGDTQVTKALTTRFIVSDFITTAMADAPPLVVQGCVSGITGTPDIISDDVTIATIDGTLGCIDEGHFDYVGSGKAAEADTDGTFYQMFFGNMPESELKRMSDAEEAAGIPWNQRTMVYVEAGDNPGDPWGQNLGSGTNIAGTLTLDFAATLYFDSSIGCPTINGNTTIWGLVFYEASSCDVTVGAHGGGKLIVYGTVAFSGDLTKFNANTEIYDLDLSDDNEDGDEKQILAVMPGSWKDW